MKINSPILTTLKKKLIQIMYTLDESELKYYYFLLYNTTFISVSNIISNKIDTDNNNNLDELDYYLDNIPNKIVSYLKEFDRCEDIEMIFL